MLAKEHLYQYDQSKEGTVPFGNSLNSGVARRYGDASGATELGGIPTGQQCGP